jgi:hypothetical protein
MRDGSCHLAPRIGCGEIPLPQTALPHEPELAALVSPIQNNGILMHSFTYEGHTIDGTTIYMLSSDTVFKDTEGEEVPGSGKDDLIGQILFNNNLSAGTAVSLEQELMQAFGGPRSVNPSTCLRNKFQALGESNSGFTKLEFEADDGLVIEALRRAGLI